MLTRYLDAGRDMVASLQYGARCPCGYCHIEDVESHKQDDHMESFFLAETGQCLGLTHGQKFGIAYSEEEDSAYEHESKIQPKGHSVIVIPSAATRQSVDSDESKLIGTKERSEGPVTITNRTENEVDDVNEQSSADS